MLLEHRLQATLRLPFRQDVAKRFETVKAQISGVGDGLDNVVWPGDAGMTYLDIPFLFSQAAGSSGGSRAQGCQFHQATTAYRLFQQATLQLTLQASATRVLLRAAIVQEFCIIRKLGSSACRRLLHGLSFCSEDADTGGIRRNG